MQCPRRRLTVTLVKGGCRAPGGGAQCPQWGGCVRSAPGGGRSALWWKNAKGKTIRNFNPVLHPVFVYQEGGNSPPMTPGSAQSLVSAIRKKRTWSDTAPMLKLEFPPLSMAGAVVPPQLQCLRAPRPAPARNFRSAGDGYWASLSVEGLADIPRHTAVHQPVRSSTKPAGLSFLR